jgi:hypothetical protein
VPINPIQAKITGRYVNPYAKEPVDTKGKRGATGPAPAGTGYVHVTNDELDTPVDLDLIYVTPTKAKLYAIIFGGI